MSNLPLFSKTDGELYALLREKVDRFFKEKKMTRKANGAMIAKSILFLLLLFLAYALLFLSIPAGWSILWKSLLLGIAVAFSTMNISHDGLHGAYSHSRSFNCLLGYLMDICGKSSYFWGKEHVGNHHTFTNIGGHDHDLALENPFLRLCPMAPYYFYHRFQHIYAPFLYALYPLFSQFEEIKKTFRLDDLSRKAQILILKAFHFYLFFFLPHSVLQISWTQAVLGYVCYGVGVGITLALVFQLAHIVEDTAFPTLQEESKIEDSFLIHQLKTTANFSTQSKLAHFFFGGLNYQVEHHLFPHICHIHLSQLSTLIKETLQGLQLPYHENRTAWEAIKSHFNTLKKLGRKT